MILGVRSIRGRGCISAVKHLSSTTSSLEETWQTRWDTCRAGGGEKALKRHVVKNKKLPVREKISKILDPDSAFLELGRQAGLELRYGDVPCAGSVSGIGIVRGVLTMIMASDATVKGGTVYPITLKKQLRMQEIAQSCKMPCLYIVDSGGAYLPEQANIFIEGGRSFYNQAIMSSKGIPQISLVCGSCTAGAAYSAVMPSHCVIMKGIGSLYLAGPPLVKAATGEEVSAEELGGADLHCTQSGSTDYYVEGYDEAIQAVRDITHIHSDLFPAPLSWNETQESSKITYTSSIDEIVNEVLDRKDITRYKDRYGEGITCYFGKINRQKVGVVGGNGVIGAKDALKASNFVQLCEQADVPVIFIQGNVKMKQYTRELASMLRSVAIATIPKITLLVGHSTGHSYLAMGGGGLQPDFMFAWPGCQVSFTEEETDTYGANLNSWDMSSKMICDDIILPGETREKIRLALLSVTSYRYTHLKSGKNSVLKF